MNNENDRNDPWPIRPYTDAERVGWSRLNANNSWRRMRDRSAFGVGIWALTIGAVATLLFMPRGTTSAEGIREPCPALLDEARSSCVAQYVETLGLALLITVVGLVVGTIVFVPSRKDIIPES